MLTNSKRAVLALANRDALAALSECLNACGIEKITCAFSGNEAFDAVKSCATDVLLSDLILPGMDGITLCERIRSAALGTYPAMLLLTLFQPSQFEMVRIQNCGAQALQRPCEAEALHAAIAANAAANRALPEAARVRTLEILISMGIPEHCGRAYLLRAILLCWQDERYLHRLTRVLYPLIAAENGVKPRHVERAMRHVIDSAWQSGAHETQYKLFGDTIDAMRGNPTCGEMIARIADILRWEGYR